MRRHPALVRATLTLTALVFVAAGCGDDSVDPKAEDASPENSSAAAATGDEIKGTGYTYNVPEGWATPAQKPPGFDPDSLAADQDDDDDFTDNVNVILSPAGEITPEQVETAGVQELESVKATDVTVEDRVTVAGSESAHLSAGMSLNSQNYTIDQFYVVGDGETFIVTFSFSPDVSAEDRAAVTGPTLASWTWTD